MNAQSFAWTLVAAGLFIAGWYSGRRNFTREIAARSRSFAADYRLGLGYLIQNQRDRALEVLLKQLAVSPDSFELYMSLANVYRRQGEVDRAILLHQHLSDERQKHPGCLGSEQWQQIELALVEDYLAAGLLDRAEDILVALLKQPSHLLPEIQEASLRHLLAIYQREKEWLHAISVAKSLFKLGISDVQQRLAHFYCELAEAAYKDLRFKDSLKHFQAAIQWNGHAIRAFLGLARLSYDAKEYAQALKYLLRLEALQLYYLPQALSLLEACYLGLNREQAYQQYVQDVQNTINSVWPHLDLKGQNPKNHFVCKDCGFQGKTQYWQCPSCQQWDSVELQLPASLIGQSAASSSELNTQWYGVS